MELVTDGPSLEMWYAALHSARGIKLETDDIEAARQRLYAIRKKANDPQLETLSITTSPTNPNHLWIVHNKVASKPNVKDIDI